jgi:hypothetical protein
VRAEGGADKRMDRNSGLPGPDMVPPWRREPHERPALSDDEVQEDIRDDNTRIKRKFDLSTVLNGISRIARVRAVNTEHLTQVIVPLRFRD